MRLDSSHLFKVGVSLQSLIVTIPIIIKNFKERYGVVLSQDDAERHYSAIISIYLVGSLLGGISGGWLADRYHFENANEVDDTCHISRIPPSLFVSQLNGILK